MRVGIVGATGLIGRRLAMRLHERGDEVLAVSRRGTQVLGARACLAWDPARGPAPAALGEVEAVVNLSGEPLQGRWTGAKKAEIRNSRLAATGGIVGLLGGDGPRVLVSASAVGYYGDGGADVLTEASPAGRDFLADVCRDWEAAARAGEARGARVAMARIGLALAREGGALPPIARVFRSGVGGPVAGGRQYVAWVHIDDVVSAFVWLLDHEDASGPFNLTAPEPSPQGEMAHAIGHQLRRPALTPTPAFAARMALGEAAILVLDSQRAVPRALLDAGFRFEVPDLAEALRRELA